MKSSGNAVNPVNFLINPSVAKAVFANHELILTNDKDSDSDSESDHSASSAERPAVPENVDTRTSVKKGKGECLLVYANLRKPTKPTVLLHHSLTNANGETWSRQRYCVSRAFNVDKFLRETCASYAAGKTIEIILEASKKQASSFRRFLLPWRKEGKSVLRKGRGLDVRILAREVAIHTMSRMVLGSIHGANDELIDSLRDMVTETLQPKRNEEQNLETMKSVEKIDLSVRSAIEAVSKEIDMGRNEGDCLVSRLLFYERNEQPGKYLTRDEVVGNSHSALLAGIQTICTTIAGAISHLAENPQMQTNLKVGYISGKDIVKETLRILPPVAGLPRIPIDCDLVFEHSSMRSNSENTVNSSKCFVAKDQLLVVDLLAFAHSQPSGMIENQSYVTLDSLKFDPSLKCKSQAQPWGIGKRKCPAGIISVECISAVLEGLATGGVTWTFTDTKDCVGLERCGGWMGSISYCPTLCYDSPIFVNFTVH